MQLNKRNTPNGDTYIIDSDFGYSFYVTCNGLSHITYFSQRNKDYSLISIGRSRVLKNGNPWMYTSALKAKPISWKKRWKNIDHVTAKGRVRTQKIYELSS